MNMMPMESKTEKGLKYFGYGFILYIVGLAVLFVLLIAFFSLLPSMVDDPENAETEILAPLLGLAAGLCLGILFMIIALIIFLVGLIAINTGRTEFGEPHANSASRGTVLVIIGFLIGLFGGIAGQIGSSIVGIFSTILIALGLIYLIYEIADDKGKQMLWIAGILYIVISIISAVITIWLFSTYDLYDVGTEAGATEEEVLGNVSAAMMLAMGIGSFALIPFLLFLLAYRRTYLRVKNREIQPMAPMYPMPYAGPYPPGYPPYPPYPPSPPSYPPPVQQQYYPAQPIGYKEPIPSETKHCVFCGASIPMGATICPRCGKKQ